MDIPGEQTWGASPKDKGYKGELSLRIGAYKKWLDWQNMFNSQGVAIVPYCMNCTVALTWEVEVDVPIALKCPVCQGYWKIIR